MSDPLHRAPVKTAFPAGVTYFALVFTVGFVLGVVRTIVVQHLPSGGRLIGVLIELPIMLWASWLLCAWVLRRFAVASTVRSRAVMGGFALGLLLLAEIGTGAMLFGRTPVEHLALYREASYALGLAAQVGFGLMPLIDMMKSKRR